MIVPFHFDWTVNVASVISFIAMLVMGFRALYLLYSIAWKVEEMWHDYQRRIEGLLRTRRDD